jgi:DNA-binding PadR family transcriptional regulator
MAKAAPPSFDPEAYLPLKKDAFHILVALADADRHGYSIMREVAARTDGKVRLSPSGLYGAIKKLLDDGLIEELTERPEPDEDDERRRYYRLTRRGRQVAAAEGRRLESLLAYVKASGLLRHRG